jgi:hypothetical protein
MLEAIGAWNYLSDDEMRLVSFIVESLCKRRQGPTLPPEMGGTDLCVPGYLLEA